MATFDVVTPNVLSGPYFGGNEDARGRPIWEIAADYNRESRRLNRKTIFACKETRVVRRVSTNYEPVGLR